MGNIFSEVEKKAVKHYCQACKTNYCKKTKDDKCAFCGSTNIITVEEE